jgi:O-antigen ligase
MGSGLLATVNQAAGRTAQWAAVALGLSIPISTALDGVLLAVVAAGWLLAARWRETGQALRDNAVALAALALFALLALGTLYGERNPGDPTGYLGKYLDLLFIPVFLLLFRDAATRRRALHALAASLVLVLAMSYLIAAGLPVGKPLIGKPGNPVVVKQYLTHGILMAYGAFLFAELALAATSRRGRILWFLAALAAALNAMLMVQSRTGYVLLVVLGVYLVICRLQRRQRALALAVLAACVVALVFIPGPFQQRLGLAADKQAPSLATQYAQISNAERLEMYRTSLEIIREHPLLGVGTGGFPRAYAEKSRGGSVPQSRNPHNEYLLVAVHIGLPGLLVLLSLFWAHWRAAPRLASTLEQHLARGLLLAIAVGCLFNSLLLDHTEGLLFAWLTGVLFAGLGTKGPGFPNPR